MHLGDLGHFPTDEQLEKIKDADYLLIPVGGYYTIEPETAVKICLAANPKHIIPMHYRTTTYGYPELPTIGPFLTLAHQAGLADVIE